VADAHRLVRARLVDLSGPAPLGGLRAALDELCERSRRRGLPVSLHAPDDLVVAPAATAAVLRVLGEALSNAERHAEASRVDVSLATADGVLELRVADDGRGFAGPQGEAARSPDGHFGLTLMRDRAAEVGGRLSITSSPGGGTTVALRLALPST
jgi:signal transduction histidine kinase